ncbi:hypothetical protein OXX69_008069 [Metschnikowia pulcherrima]
MEYYSSLDASKLDQNTPTLFELISASQLESLLSPSLRYILVHYAQKHPGYLLRIANRFDEINFVLRTAIEWYFFKYWRGSFTENFYGIKRVSQTFLSNKKYDLLKVTQVSPVMIEDRQALSPLQTAISIFEVTGLPYILEKTNYEYELLYSKHITNQLVGDDSQTSVAARKIKLQKTFVKVYPYMQSFWRLSNLMATLSYLGGVTKSPSFLTLLFRISFSRLSQHDYSRNERPASSRSSSKINRVAPSSHLDQAVRLAKKFIFKPSFMSFKLILGTFFPLAIFTLKFLEWWNTSDFAQTVAKSQRIELEESIPPPSLLAALIDKRVSNIKNYRPSSVCPLCNGDISNPAIIETGHVFCYTCIYNHLRDSGETAREKRSTAPTTSEEKPTEDNIGEVENLSESALSPIEYGGRCPITGQKLLGCTWNTITGEYDVNGVRRLIF